MSNMNETEIRRHLELLSTVEPSPESTDRAMQRVRRHLMEASERPQARAASTWRIVMESRIAKLAVAAGIILAILIGLNIMGDRQMGGVAWAQVLENIQQVRSCIHRMQMTISREDQPDTKVEFRMLRSSDFGIRRDAYVRGELATQLYVPWDTEKCVEVIPSQKRYVKAIFGEAQLAEIREKNDPRELAKLVMSFEHTDLGVRTINGRQCEGLEVNDPRFGRTLFEEGIGRMWADVETDLPVLMEFVGTSAGGAIHTRIVLDEFDWQASLTAADFEPNIPADYTVMAEVDLSPGAESAVNGLRIFAGITGGKYPSSLDLMTSMREVQYAFIIERRKRGVAMEQEPTKDEIGRLLAIQGVCMYYGQLMNEDRDVAYYGDRVNAEFPHAVLMRWKDNADGAGVDTYRVILGGLTVRDVTAPELEALEAAPLNLAPQAIRPEPADGTVGVPLLDLKLSWLPGAGAIEHRLYLGTAPDDLPLLATGVDPSFVHGLDLQADTTYYWRVDEVSADGTIETGTRWSFDTGQLVALWSLDEGEGTAVADSSGNDHTGVLKGDPTWTTGAIGGALEFDGDGDYVDLGTSPSFDIADRITVAAWIKVNAFDVDWQTIISKGDVAWRLSRSQGDNLHFACTGLWPEWVHGTANVNDGQWHHAAGVYDGATLRLYVDGRLDVSVATAGRINVCEYPVTIGENLEEPQRAWNGAIDEVRLYNYALSEIEVKALYDAKP